MTGAPSTRSRRAVMAWTVVVCLHGAVVAILLALFTILVASAPPDSGANIGAGLVGLPLLGLGLPWTLLVVGSFDPSGPLGVWLAEVDSLGTIASFTIRLVPAVLNLAIHIAVYLGWRYRRRRNPV